MTAVPPVENRFVPGQSGNPGGKPKAARNKLSGLFLNRLVDDFEAHGVKAIEAARIKDPVGYIRAIAALMPKQIERAQPLDDMTDDELNAAIAIFRAGREQVLSRPGEGAGATSSSTKAN